jgi:protein-disulfide isomerase
MSQSKRAARDKLAEERRRQALADQRRRRLTNIAMVVAVTAAVVVIFVLVVAAKHKAPVTATLPPGVSQAGGGVVVGDPTAPVVLDLWEDFQCPVCKGFEAANANTIKTQVADGSLQVVYHPLSFLDQNNHNTASTLAANAFGCADAAGKALAFHNKVYENQPAVEGTGYTADQLIQWGQQVGITDPSFATCVNAGTYDNWVQQVEASGGTNGITGTPTLVVNGKRVSDSDRAAMTTDPTLFTKALASAATAAESGASPTPSSS